MEKHIDYEAVIDILEKFLNTKKTEILGISVGEERQVRLAIENLINRVKELEENYDRQTRHFIDNHIQKSKIREKLEEYDKQRIKMEKYDNGVGFTLDNEWSDLKAKIQVLQELMEDK